MAFREFMSFLLSRKRYWLLPLVIFVGVLAAIMYLAHRREALAPFVYSLKQVPVASPRQLG
jgi:hypothetical protein